MNLRPVTPQQITKIHVLLNQFGLIEDKPEITTVQLLRLSIG
jgi:hypothetical protein